MTAKATSPREPDGTNTKTGSGEHTTQRASGTGEDFDKKLVAYKQRMKARTDLRCWAARPDREDSSSPIAADFKIEALAQSVMPSGPK
jgi:hypothetical protein